MSSPVVGDAAGCRAEDRGELVRRQGLHRRDAGHQQQRGKLQQPTAADDGVDPASSEGHQGKDSQRAPGEAVGEQGCGQVGDDGDSPIRWRLFLVWGFYGGARREDDSVTPTVAVLGLGTMGAAMARRISGAGMATTVWNRSAGRTAVFADGPARVADEVADAVAGADVVLTMLFDAAAVESVIAEALPAMGSGAVWLQCSTVGVEAANRFATAAAAAGIRFVDAPVLGTKAPAGAGTLTALLAGSDEDLAAVEPVIAAIATKTVRAGQAAPAASALKLAMNAWIATITAGIAQSLTIADRLGLDPALVLEALHGAAADSPYAQLKGGAMLKLGFDAQFEVVGLLKDVRLAREATPGMPQQLLAALDELYAAAADGGAAHSDIAAVWRAFQD